MMKSSVVVATAVMIGFVSVLIYRVGASGMASPTQVLVPVEAIDASSDNAPPVKVEFIVSQCGIAEPEGLPPSSLPEVFNLPKVEESARLSVASAEIIVPKVSRGAEFVPEDKPAASLDSRAKGSPSFVFIQ